MTFGASSKLDNYNHQLVINGNQDRITTFSDRAPTLAEMKTQDEIYRLSRWQMERILQEAGLDPAFFPTEAEMMSQILDQWHRMRETEFSVPGEYCLSDP